MSGNSIDTTRDGIKDRILSPARIDVVSSDRASHTQGACFAQTTAAARE
jgi:hypothetical protein